MASRNGSPGPQTVALFLRVPPELHYAIKLIADRYRYASINECVRRLLETHPAMIGLTAGPEGVYTEETQARNST